MHDDGYIQERKTEYMLSALQNITTKIIYYPKTSSFSVETMNDKLIFLLYFVHTARQMALQT
jgi:hypothetical protein